MKLIKFIPFTILLLSVACGSQVTTTENVSEAHRFMIAEKESLTADGAGLQKIIQHESEQETLIVQNPDWSKELSPFLSLMNSPMPTGTYQVSESEQSGRKTVEYLAADSTMQLKQLILIREKDQIRSLTAVKKVSNIYYSSSDTLIYHAGGSYSISVINQPRIGRQTRFVLTGTAVGSRQRRTE